MVVDALKGELVGLEGPTASGPVVVDGLERGLVGLEGQRLGLVADALESHRLGAGGRRPGGPQARARWSTAWSAAWSGPEGHGFGLVVVDGLERGLVGLEGQRLGPVVGDAPGGPAPRAGGGR